MQKNTKKKYTQEQCIHLVYVYVALRNGFRLIIQERNTFVQLSSSLVLFLYLFHVHRLRVKNFSNRQLPKEIGVCGKYGQAVKTNIKPLIPLLSLCNFFCAPVNHTMLMRSAFFYLSLNPLAGSFRYFQPALDQSIYFVMFSLIFIVPIIRIRRSLTFLLAIKIEDKIQNHWYGEHMKKTLRISIDEILE